MFAFFPVTTAAPPKPPPVPEPSVELQLRRLIAEMLDRVFLGDWPPPPGPDVRHPNVWQRAVTEARLP